MVEERYPGERRGLSLFLEELLPAVERCGTGRPQCAQGRVSESVSGVGESIAAAV